MLKLNKVLGSITLAIIGTGIAAATPITTTSSLSVAGLTFSFGANSCVLTTSGANTPTACSQIDVSTVDNPNIGTGLQISSGFGASNNHYTDVMLSYNLASTSSINQIGLSFVGGILGDAIVRIDETAYSNGVQVGFASVHCAALSFGGGCPTSTGLVMLDGSYNDLTIVKDIYLDANVNSSANTSAIYQTFDAPEPMSMALIGSGLLVIGVSRFRRTKKA